MEICDFGNHVFEAGIKVSERIESLESSTMARVCRGCQWFWRKIAILGQGQL